MNEFTRGPSKNITLLILLVLLILVIGIGYTAIKKSGVPQVDPNVYQMVFLENNYQYFGHLHGIDTKYPYLTDVYYVKAQGVATDPDQQQFSLVKMGGEIHGPEDVMYLNWKRILLWENLKPDSKVVQGIAQEKAKRAAGTQAAQ